MPSHCIQSSFLPLAASISTDESETCCAERSGCRGSTGRRELKGRWKTAAGCCRAEPAAGNSREHTDSRGVTAPPLWSWGCKRGEKKLGDRGAHAVIIPLAQGQHAFTAETCCELAKGRMTHAAAAPHVQNYPQYTSPSSPPEGTKPKAGKALQKQLLALGTSPESSQSVAEGPHQPVTLLYLWVVFLG